MKHVKVKVFPGARKEALEKVSDDKYRVFLREPAKNNRANKRLLAVIAGEVGVEENKIRIISRHKYLNKILEIKS